MAARLGVRTLLLSRPRLLSSSSPLLSPTSSSLLLSSRRILPLSSFTSPLSSPLFRSSSIFSPFPQRNYSSETPPQDPPAPPSRTTTTTTNGDKKRAVLVDGSIFYPKKKRSTSDSSTTVSEVDLEVFQREFNDLLIALQPTHLGVAFDSELTTSWRRAANPEYRPKLMRKGINGMKNLINKEGGAVLTEDGMESGDLIAAVSEKIRNEPDVSILIVSQNEDGRFKQLLAPNVNIYNPSTGKMTKYKDFLPTIEEYPLFDFEMLQRVKGVGKKSAKNYLNRHQSLDQFIEEAPQMQESEYGNLKMDTLMHRLGRNVKLSCLEDNTNVLGNLYLKDGAPSRINLDEEEPLSVPFPFEIPRVTLVQTVEKAREVVAQLLTLNTPNIFHAIDTETKEFDIKALSPVENAKMICFSIFCGNEYDFGNGPLIWVDTMGEECEGILEEFIPYLTDKKTQKIFHNYSFDAHVFANDGIQLGGFAGDTMHMCRLWDCSLQRYSLENLSNSYLKTKKESMQSLFGVSELTRLGTIRKVKKIPKLEALQRSPSQAEAWIDYSVKDAETTLELHSFLKRKLKSEKIQGQTRKTLYDFYNQHWLPLGEALYELERNGFYINSQYLHDQEEKAIVQRDKLENEFLTWAIEEHSPDCKYMNPNSKSQIGHLLFGKGEKTFEVPNDGFYNPHNKQKIPAKRQIVFKGFGLSPISVTPTKQPQVNGEVLRQLAGDDPSNRVYGKLVENLEDKDVAYTASIALDKLIQMTKINTTINGFLSPLPKMVDSVGRVHASLNLNTETGRLSCRKPNLQNQPSHERDPFKVRKAFCAEKGNKLIVADYSQLELRILAAVTDCKSMREAFIKGGDFHSRTAIGMYPYIQTALDEGKVLLEWDTSQGVAPTPLLKDQYKIERNRAKILNFSIAYGKTAHGLSKDFNVTVKEANEIIDKWYADRPEVRKWQKNTKLSGGTSKRTYTMLKRYRPLPDLGRIIKKENISPNLSEEEKQALSMRDREALKKRGHAERAAINTPIQGGAADVVNTAMVKLFQHEKLRKMGWRLLMQIHDELILEGPEGSSEEALQIVLDVMENPGLDEYMNGVPLVADASIGDTWAECK